MATDTVTDIKNDRYSDRLARLKNPLFVMIRGFRFA